MLPKMAMNSLVAVQASPGMNGFQSFISDPKSVRVSTSDVTRSFSFSSTANPSSSASSESDTKETNLLDKIPSDAWDSHMHVVDPKTYPLSSDAVYTPDAYTLQEAMAFEASVGISNIVLVQPSIYGFDNSCMLDAMKQLGPSRCRGVVVFDPLITSLPTLQEWHALGVRGVRLNLKSVDKSLEVDELESVLRQYDDLVRSLGWVIQVYVPMHLIPSLERIIPQLGVRVCIDHIGHPALQDLQRGRDPYDIAGFMSLVRLLKGGKTFVKLSAPYRICATKDDLSILDPVVHELLAVAGKSRVVFATDWPHTRFEGLDIRPWMQGILDQCGNDQVLIERLFRGNAKDLWGIE